MNNYLDLPNTFEGIAREDMLLFTSSKPAVISMSIGGTATLLASDQDAIVLTAEVCVIINKILYYITLITSYIARLLHLV